MSARQKVTQVHMCISHMRLPGRRLALLQGNKVSPIEFRMRIGRLRTEPWRR